MQSYTVYCSLSDRKKALVYQTKRNELVETLVSHSTKILSKQKLHNKVVQVVKKQIETCIFFIRIKSIESSIKMGKQ